VSLRRVTGTIYECRCNVTGCKWFYRGFVESGIAVAPIAERALKRHLLDKHEIANPRIRQKKRAPEHIAQGLEEEGKRPEV
jgi:hypothetical protein